LTKQAHYLQQQPYTPLKSTKVATYKDTYALTYFALNLQGACLHAIAKLEGKANARRFDCPTHPIEVAG